MLNSALRYGGFSRPGKVSVASTSFILIPLYFIVLVKLSLMANHQTHVKFIDFLEKEFALSTMDISVALRKHELDNSPLSMLLWQYGLVDIEQLERILDWLEDQS